MRGDSLSHLISDDLQACVARSPKSGMQPISCPVLVNHPAPAFNPERGAAGKVCQHRLQILAAVMETERHRTWQISPGGPPRVILWRLKPCLGDSAQLSVACCSVALVGTSTTPMIFLSARGQVFGNP